MQRLVEASGGKWRLVEASRVVEAGQDNGEQGHMTHGQCQSGCAVSAASPDISTPSFSLSFPLYAYMHAYMPICTHYRCILLVHSHTIYAEYTTIIQTYTYIYIHI
jgi:hypothetical protein